MRNMALMRNGGQRQVGAHGIGPLDLLQLHLPRRPPWRPALRPVSQVCRRFGASVTAAQIHAQIDDEF